MTKEEIWYRFSDRALRKMLVGRLVKELSSEDARRLNLIKSKKAGNVLLLKVPGISRVFSTRKNSAKKLTQEEVQAECSREGNS